MCIRWKEEIDSRCRPLITSDEWRKLIVKGRVTDDWERRNERDPNGKWRILGNAGFITLRPHPGVDEEGNASDDGALVRDEFAGCDVAKKRDESSNAAVDEGKAKNAV